MSQAGPCVLAFVLASLLTTVELITTKYPHTAYLLRRCWALYAYALIYGVIAVGVTIFWNALSTAGMMHVQGADLSNPWLRALAVGFTVKAFLHVRFFSVTVGSDSFPIGIETAVQLFEPWLLSTIDLDHFLALGQYIGTRAAKYNNLQNVQTAIQQNTPQNPSTLSRAFLSDVQRSTTVADALRLYLTFVGTKLFDSTFPV